MPGRKIVFTDLETKEIRLFRSLKTFYDVFPEYLKKSESIKYYLTRKKEPFQDTKIKLERKPVE